MAMRPTYISPSIQRHLGYTVDEALALKMEQVFSPQSYASAMDMLTAELVRENEPGNDPDRGRLLEVELVHKTGCLVPFEIHYSGIREGDGRLVEVVAVARDITVRRAAEEFRLFSARRTVAALQQTVRALSILGEMRDSYTAAHQRRVAGLVWAMGDAMGLNDHALQGLRLAGLIHDIGKVHVPAEILTRPGRLSPAEFEIIKTHPAAGYEVLSGIEFPWAIAETVYQHHERLDGSGYPRGLGGDDIIPEARILAVADVVEAIASDRPYRPALGADTALSEISTNKGRLYDASVVDACLKVFREGYQLDDECREPGLSTIGAQATPEA